MFEYLGIKPEYNVLDAGCGTGVLTRYLACGLTSGKMTGFDINEGFIEYGQRKLRELALESKIRIELADGFKLKYPDGSFDAVTNYTYIGVLSDPVAGLRELIRVCKPGGVISCIVAPNKIPAIHWQGDYPFADAGELQRLSTRESNIFAIARLDSDFGQSEEWHDFRSQKCSMSAG